MRNLKSAALKVAALSVFAQITAASAKEIELNCKTTSGTSVPYQIVTSPPSIKDTRDGERYEIVVFSQSKLVFKKKISINLGATYYDTEFLHTINRSNLDYQVSIRTYTNSDKLKSSSTDGTFIGKCVVNPKKPVIF